MHGETISAGASGAIFGLYGIFLAFLFFHRIAKEQRKALLTSILIFVGYNLVYGMKAGIDNAAHIGGLLSGFLLGIIYVCSYKFEKADAQRTVSILGGARYLLHFPVQLLDALQERSPSLSGHTRRMGKRYCRSSSEW